MSEAQNEVRTRGKSPRRATTFGLVFMGAGLLIFLLFAQGVTKGQTTTFALMPRQSKSLVVPDLSFPTLNALYAFAALSVFIGGWQLARGFRRVNLALGAVAGIFVLAFLAWAARDNSLNLTGLLSSALLRAVPIALAALSGVICERCAVINIGIEGMMLTGAFVATLMGSLAAMIWEWPTVIAQLFGLTSALASGALLGLLLAVLAVRFKIDQIIAGTAINILATGITSFLSARILAEFTQLNRPGIFPRFAVP
ncbi:MAG: ABC transporter permease, partial [Anaerolineae bacterium]